MSHFNKELIPETSDCRNCATSAVLVYEGLPYQAIERSRELFGTEDGNAGIVFCAYMHRVIPHPAEMIKCPFWNDNPPKKRS